MNGSPDDDHDKLAEIAGEYEGFERLSGDEIPDDTLERIRHASSLAYLRSMGQEFVDVRPATTGPVPDVSEDPALAQFLRGIAADSPMPTGHHVLASIEHPAAQRPHRGRYGRRTLFFPTAGCLALFVLVCLAIYFARGPASRVTLSRAVPPPEVIDALQRLQSTPSRMPRPWNDVLAAMPDVIDLSQPGRYSLPIGPLPEGKPPWKVSIEAETADLGEGRRLAVVQSPIAPEWSIQMRQGPNEITTLAVFGLAKGELVVERSHLIADEIAKQVRFCRLLISTDGSTRSIRLVPARELARPTSGGDRQAPLEE